MTEGDDFIQVNCGRCGKSLLVRVRVPPFTLADHHEHLNADGVLSQNWAERLKAPRNLSRRSAVRVEETTETLATVNAATIPLLLYIVDEFVPETLMVPLSGATA
jgi:hypothetical protein